MKTIIIGFLIYKYAEKIIEDGFRFQEEEITESDQFMPLSTIIIYGIFKNTPLLNKLI